MSTYFLPSSWGWGRKFKQRQVRLNPLLCLPPQLFFLLDGLIVHLGVSLLRNTAAERVFVHISKGWRNGASLHFSPLCYDFPSPLPLSPQRGESSFWKEGASPNLCYWHLPTSALLCCSTANRMRRKGTRCVVAFWAGGEGGSSTTAKEFKGSARGEGSRSLWWLKYYLIPSHYQ